MSQHLAHVSQTLRRTLVGLAFSAGTTALAQAPEAMPAPSTVATVAPPVEGAPAEPFAFADFSWVPGNAGASEKPLSFGPFTGELRVDTAYHYSLANPVDDTISGSSEVFRHGEVQVTQLGIGGDFNSKNVQARLMTQFGLYSVTTPRNDASPARGQWDLANAYRYISEAYGGYHWNALHGINLQAGIFMSYIGLWSYYNADNWTYQPSYVSSNTPWFFNGVRAQIFVTDRLKIEPWIINGWQSYGRFNDVPGFGGQILWRPTGSVAIVSNNYVGKDWLGLGKRIRIHTDDSVMVKYLDTPEGFVSKAAASVTFDAGCEWGDGAACNGQYFLGFMAYNRLWFDHNRFGFTVGGGAINNPGRYLVLVPPINGATAFSGAPAYFTQNVGDQFTAWDLQIAADYAPREFMTFRAEFNHREASIPYFAGHGGVTPPGGNTIGAPGSAVDGWAPDLVKDENRFTLAMLVKM